jgi:hypothetical protein
LHGLRFDPEDGSDTFLPSVGVLIPNHTALVWMLLELSAGTVLLNIALKEMEH